MNIYEIMESCMKNILTLVGKDFMSQHKEIKNKGVRVAFTLAEGATHVAMLKNVRRCAFTLAEVLITLGIIGVVAALTLPTLIQNHQKQVYVTGLKKAYSNIQNAFNKMAYDEGVTNWKDMYCYPDWSLLEYEDWVVHSNDCLDRFTKQFNIIEKKYYRESCSAEWCNYFETSHIDNMGTSDPMFVTTDGSTYLFYCGSITDIIVDVNGSKAPNKFGRDIFEFNVDFSKNKIEPAGISQWDPEGWKECTTEAVNNNSEGAKKCTAKILIEGKMNY